MTHEEYSKALMALQDKAGKSTSESVLNYTKRILKASKGDPGKFVLMVKKLRPVIIKKLAVDYRIGIKKSKSLGKKFGESKLA